MMSDARLRAVRGPVGSAKTTMCYMDLFKRACEAPIQSDGIRRSKMVIVRNTLQQIKTTCLVSWMQMLRPVSNYKVSDQTIELRLPGVESDILLLPLDTEANIQRLLSLELTWAWASEFRELDPEVIQALLSRVGRYPSRAMISEEDRDYKYGVIMETNSFNEDSPWYELLEENLPANWDYFVQPGAFEDGAENRENLAPSYYEDLMESNSPEWVEQYVHNRISPSLSGQAVFRRAFDPAWHVAENELHPIPGYPLIIGMDTGRNPAAVICQVEHTGRMLVLGSLAKSNMGMEKFLEEHLNPVLMTERLNMFAGYLILDPACTQRSQIGEESVLGCVKRLGFQAQPATTNNIDPRLRAVEKMLLASRNGGPAILFDAEHNHELILAMQSRYRYKIKKDKSLEEKPDKKHPWSDLADALQYACLGTNSRMRGRMMTRLGHESSYTGDVNEPSALGWT